MRFQYSVVIPTRGRKGYLGAALESVYAQTLPPSQVIVVVDGDTDGTVAFLQQRFPGVEVIEHLESRGASASRNAGLKAVKFDWVALLDDDDIWHSRKQEAFAEYLEANPECEAMRSGFWQFSAPGAATEMNGFRSEVFSDGKRADLESQAEKAVPLNDFGYLEIEGESLRKLLKNNRGVTSTTVFRRRLLAQVPVVPDDLRTAQDWVLFVFLATVTEWHLVPGRWMFYRVHGDQITKTLGPSRWRYRVRAWELVWEKAGYPMGYELQNYSIHYATEAHSWLWSEIRSGRWLEAISLYRSTGGVIPSKKIRLSMLLPPPLRWRVRRWL